MPATKLRRQRGGLFQRAVDSSVAFNRPDMQRNAAEIGESRRHAYSDR